MASSATFAMVRNPRICFSRRHQFDPLHDPDLRPYTRLTLTRVLAEDNPQKQAARLAPCPHSRLRGLEFTWILWCALGYFYSKAVYQKSYSLCCPPSPRVRSKEDVSRAAQAHKTQVHVATSMDFFVPKHAELAALLQYYKGRVVLRGDNVKDDLGCEAVFTEQGA